MSSDALSATGERLFAELVDGSSSEAVRVLALEAARIADRLDKLDLVLRGDVDVWMTLVHDNRTEDYELRIDDAAREARQQATVLRSLVSEVLKIRPPVEADDDDDCDV
ncbi:hypothetical protein [Gordonia sp. 852002-10350_SCH5691597]|uniref:hypothetical protein n=1 Tax=Gordonia sp. 852002-10350_SCH5691597 TaxID=1834085 RepID=UPI0009ED2D91|nr:hypothetical protein [Gordonia sp. 852002-10350_SCH5691597]DAL34379.1 MAG TPA_asm: terminase small subunit [Caudoviricetes sp.]